MFTLVVVLEQTRNIVDKRQIVDITTIMTIIRKGQANRHEMRQALESFPKIHAGYWVVNNEILSVTIGHASHYSLPFLAALSPP